VGTTFGVSFFGLGREKKSQVVGGKKGFRCKKRTKGDGEGRSVRGATPWGLKKNEGKFNTSYRGWKKPKNLGGSGALGAFFITKLCQKVGALGTSKKKPDGPNTRTDSGVGWLKVKKHGKKGSKPGVNDNWKRMFGGGGLGSGTSKEKLLGSHTRKSLKGADKIGKPSPGTKRRDPQKGENTKSLTKKPHPPDN